jgi:hypothetical protein
MCEKEDEHQSKDTVTTFGAILDSAYTQYQVEWQRIGNMQQSAGALVSAMAIIYSALSIVILLPSDSPCLKDTQYFNLILLPAYFTDLLFLLITTFFFFMVIWPKDVKAITSPMAIANQLKEKQLWQNLADLIRDHDESIRNLHELVQSKQTRYRRALVSCITALAVTIGLMLLLIFKISAVESKFYLFHLLLLSLAIVSLIVTFTRR